MLEGDPVCLHCLRSTDFGPALLTSAGRSRGEEHFMTTEQITNERTHGRYVGAREMAQLLGNWASRQSVLRRARLGQIPFIRWGHRVMFDPQAVFSALDRSAHKDDHQKS